MNVICVDNGGLDRNCPSLTIGKSYYVIYPSINGQYVVINDHGQSGYYDVKRFKQLSDIREEKLKQLGI